MKVISRSVVRTATKGGEFQNKCANARAPKLAPKPVTHNVKIGEDVQQVVVETVDNKEYDADDDHEPQTGDMNSYSGVPTPNDEGIDEEDDGGLEANEVKTRTKK